mmetsp:Transcript_8059/g.13350  ORF Transcript_8059/g.13350 Transcript_8059/m.13350 type:complete len:339 (+) Transcript_8059:93-1109(+)
MILCATKPLAAAVAVALLSCESAVAFSSSNNNNLGGLARIRSTTSKKYSIQRRQQQPQPTSTTLYLGDFFNFGKPKQEEEEEEEETAPTPEEEAAQTGYVDNDDPIEKIFGIFFGKKEAEPMGMKRFGQERFPEQYPAVLDEWADPVVGDDKEMALLRPLLKNTNLETRNLRLTYDANRDGWDPTIFHSKVDKQGGAIVFCTTRAGIQCGGYNPKGWVGYGEARGSIAAFLYILGGKYAAPGAPAIKLRKVGGPGLAQMDLPESGPSFSPDALVIPLGKEGKLARSKLGSYYERLPDGTNSLFGKDGSVQLRDLKVYHGVYEEGEYIPFTDAEPFALY